MSWFYLALFVPLLFAVVNLIDDNLLQFVYKSRYIATVMAGVSGTLPLLSLFFLDFNNIPTNLALLSMLSGSLAVGFYFFYFKSLQLDSPSVVVALFSLVPATIPFLAYFIVDEKLGLQQIVGFSIVLLASLGLAVSDVRNFKFSKALIPAVIAVIFMDAEAIINKYVYNNADFYPAYMYFSLGMGITAFLFYFVRFSDNNQALIRIGKKFKRLIPILIFVELLGLLAEFLLNLAISKGPVSLVKVIEGSQPMFVLLIALLLYPFAPKFFREAEDSKPVLKFALMAVIIVGLGVIAAASNNA